jgi:hypothetical protein
VTSRWKRLAVLVAAGCVASAMLAGSASAAPSKKDCFQPGPLRAAPGALKPGPTQVCFAFRSGDVINDFGDPVGRLNRGFSWFVCQAETARPNPPVSFGRGSNAFNDHWLLTLSDTKLDGRRPGNWGWFPATHISAGGPDEPIPGVPFCDASESIPGPFPEPIE